jgi:hypothetical protein
MIYIATMKKNFLVAALTLATATLASALLSAPAKAQVPPATANVPITVEVPPIVYLETYASLNFIPTLADLSNPGALPTPTQVGTVNNFTTPVVNDPLNGGGTITFTPNKTLTGLIVYKVWGLGGPNGNIVHGATYAGNLTKGTNGSTIGVTLANNSTTSPAPGLNYNQAINGTLDMTFNFTDVKESGTHTGGSLTITATAQ